MATVKTLTVYPSGYVSDDYAYDSASNLENGYNSADNTTYATINLTTGAHAETYIYYTFDLSAIPDGAVITGVSCSANVTISSTSVRYISSRTMQLYSGTTAKGSSASIPERRAATTITAGDWTRDELTDCRLKLYAKRTRSGTTTAININFYGASLTIEYAEPDIIPIVGNITVGGVAKTLAGGYVNIGGVWKTICKSYSNINGIWKPTYKAGEVTFTWKKYAVEQVVTSTTYSLERNADAGCIYKSCRTLYNDETTYWLNYYNNTIGNSSFYTSRSVKSSTGSVTYSGQNTEFESGYSSLTDATNYLSSLSGQTLYSTREMSGTIDGLCHIELSYMEGTLLDGTAYIGISINEKIVTETKKYTDAQGEYIEDVTSSDYNAYPENGVQDGYWYVRQ